jgi:hypothetical protein
VGFFYVLVRGIEHLDDGELFLEGSREVKNREQIAIPISLKASSLALP